MRKIIDIDKLILNPKNYRFDPVETQAEATDLMLEQKGEELFNLAKHIIENGLDEAKNFRVIEIKKDLYKVLEGNRRITVLKCLSNISLIKSDSLRNKFKKLLEEAKKEKKNIPTKVYCFVYKTEEEAAPFIRLDHTGKNDGAGLDSWGVKEKNRFEFDFGGKLSPAMQVVELYEKETKSKIEDPNDLKLSTINRILSNVEARSYLGLGITNGQIYPTAALKEVIERLDKLFNKMITEDVLVKDVYNTELTIKFMKNLFGDKPKISKRARASSKSSRKAKNKSKKSFPKSNERNTIIPEDFEIQIYAKKINNIYHELQEIPLEDYTNAAAVLFRVFLETSIDYYADKNGMPFDSTIKLAGKITKVIDDLEKKKIAKPQQLKNIKNVATKRNSILSIENFHEYVHSFKRQPIPTDLIYTWDNLQEFFGILWEEITKKEKKK